MRQGLLAFWGIQLSITAVKRHHGRQLGLADAPICPNTSAGSGERLHVKSSMADAPVSVPQTSLLAL